MNANWQKGLEMLEFAKPLIQTLERLLPESGQGAVKLAALKAGVGTAFKTEAQFEAIWNDISPMISVLVPSLTAPIKAINAALVVTDQVAAVVAPAPAQ